MIINDGMNMNLISLSARNTQTVMNLITDDKNFISSNFRITAVLYRPYLYFGSGSDVSCCYR
jgi:hypothetical protein